MSLRVPSPSGGVLSRVRGRRLARWVLVAAVAVGAGSASASAWGASSQPVGPLQADVGVAVAWDGGTRVEVPPLGTVRLATHEGPLQIRATVRDLRTEQARRLLASGTRSTVLDELAGQARAAVVRGALTSAAVALLAGAVASAVVFRRRRETAVGAVAVVVLMAAGGAVAAGTWRPQALSEPRLTGALAQAPALVGAARSFDAYSARVAELTLNVSRIYGMVSALPAALDADAVRVLWVSDIHNNPQAFDLMRQLVRQFRVEAVFDTGDITDLGSAVENRQLSRVTRLGVPYVYVRGNHDSEGVTQAFLERQPGVVVLDDAEVAEVAGLRVAGTGDPLFRPVKEVAEEREGNRAALVRAGEELAEAIRDEAEPVDVALVHEPTMAEPLLGVVPLVLDGHVHERRHRWQDDTLELTQGSSGGAGLRTLDDGEPRPLEMSVLHFGRTTGQLLAVDEVTVAGLGSRSVTVQRREPESYREEGAVEPVEVEVEEPVEVEDGGDEQDPVPQGAARTPPRSRAPA